MVAECMTRQSQKLMFENFKSLGIGLVIFMVFGCIPKMRQNFVGDQSSLLAVWLSASSKPQERANAVNKYIRKGTDIEIVENLLGQNGKRIHEHGASADLTTGLTGSYDYWKLEHTTKDGVVALSFNTIFNESGFQLVFDHSFVISYLSVGSVKP